MNDSDLGFRVFFRHVFRYLIRRPGETFILVLAGSVLMMFPFFIGLNVSSFSLVVTDAIIFLIFLWGCFRDWRYKIKMRLEYYE